jgi:hypothetical protein
LIVAAVLGAAVGLNVVAYMQARAVTSFSVGERTPRPEQLSVLTKVAVTLTGVNIPRPKNNRTPKDFDLAFETHRFANARGAMLEAWFAPGDDGRLIVVLFHGYAASKAGLLPAARILHQFGYGAFLVDFYGSGGSAGSGTTIGVREADDVTAAIAYVLSKWPDRKIVLYGFSMGGAAVMRAIAERAVNPDGIIIEATFDTLLSAAKNRFRAVGLPGSPFAELLLFWGSVQNGSNLFSHRPVDYARAVRRPALVLHGERDDRATSGEARRIARAMGANAHFISYPGVAHVPIVQARPEEWTRDTTAFLEKIR